MSKTLDEIKANLDSELEVAEIDFKSPDLISYAKGRISGFDTAISAVSEGVEFDVLYQGWIDNNGSRSPSVKSALEWMFDRMKAHVVLAKMVERGFVKQIENIERELAEAKKSIQAHADEIVSMEKELTQAKAEIEILSIKLQRTVNAARSALLEMSAWLGINPDKRENQVKALMENVEYCAEHDLRYIDESQRNIFLLNKIKLIKDELENISTNETIETLRDSIIELNKEI